MKKKHIEILLRVTLTRYHGCPIMLNCKARDPSGAVPSTMAKTVAIRAIIWYTSEM